MRVLSLGAGVQSTTLALMAAHGEIEPPDCAIFADTQWEPQSVYDHLGWLMSPNVLPFPVHVVSAGSLRASIMTKRSTLGLDHIAIPWHTVNPDGSHGMGRRQCTNEFKLKPIMREIRRLLGKGLHDRIAPNSVDVMIGISCDEAHRAKPAKQAYMRNVFPLLDLRMRRHDCLAWLGRHDYPRPPKSSCIGCPFNDNKRWRSLTPDEFADAIAVDRTLRNGSAPRGYAGAGFMHRDRVPLDEVDLTIDDRQGDLWGNECEGMCGV